MGNNPKPRALFWGMLFFFAGTILASFGPTTFKYVVLEFKMTAYNVVFYFLIFGGLSLLPFAIKDIKNNQVSMSELFSRKIFGKLILLGLFSPMSLSCYTKALMHKTVTETVPLVRLDALFAVILSTLFLGQKIKSWSKLLFAILLCIIGLFVFLEISLTKFATELFDRYIALIIIVAVLTASQEIVKRKIQKHKVIQNMTIVCLAMLLGSCTLGIYMILIKHPITPPTWQQFPYLLFLGTVTMGIAGYLSLKAYNTAKNLSKIYLLTFLRPIFASIIAFFLLGERNFGYVPMTVGFCLILIGIYIAEKQLVSEA